MLIYIDIGYDRRKKEIVSIFVCKKLMVLRRKAWEYEKKHMMCLTYTQWDIVLWKQFFRFGIFCVLGNISEVSVHASNIKMSMHMIYMLKFMFKLCVFPQSVKKQWLKYGKLYFFDQPFIGCRWTQVHRTYTKISSQISVLRSSRWEVVEGGGF